jgi:hypothetical protein
MSYIESRLRKAEQAARISHPGEEDQFMCFVRLDPWHPENPTDAETKWREEHPNFRGKIYVYTIGTKNLGPRPEGM